MEQQLEIFPQTRRPRIRFGGLGMIERLAKKAEKLTGLPPGELTRPNRHREAAFPRFAVMAIALETGRKTTVIGRHLHMDHSSVCYGAKRAVELEQEDEEFAELMRLLRAEAKR